MFDYEIIMNHNDDVKKYLITLKINHKEVWSDLFDDPVTATKAAESVLQCHYHKHNEV